MKRLACLSAAALLLLASSVFAVAWAAAPAPVQSALAMLQRGGNALADSWRYQETIKGSHGNMRLAYDPGRPVGERWRMIMIDGKAPSDAQQKRLAERAAETASAVGNGLEVGSGWLAASDYRLVKSTDDTLVYQLRPRAPKGSDGATAKLLSHLAGEFVIARSDHRPLTLRLDNFEAFSPRFGVKITAFKFIAEFKRLNGSGPLVVARTSNSVSGEVFWFNDFKNQTQVVLSHFAPVSTTAPSAQTGG